MKPLFRVYGVQSWEVVLAIIILFLACSTSLFWYDYFSKTRQYNIEKKVRIDWENNVTDHINSLKQSQTQVLNVINANILAGRLVVPQKEKK